MELDHFCKNGVVVKIPSKNLNKLIRDTTYEEKESDFLKKTHFHKKRVVCLTTVKETKEDYSTVKLPKYLTPFLFKQHKYNININDHIELHDKQKEYFKILKDTLKEKQGCCLNLRPGTGKTVIAIKLMCMLKLKTIIIVHKEFLRDQWIYSILKFTDLTRDDIGLVQGKVEELDKPVTICMLQTLWKKDKMNILYNLLIVDEVHNISANAFFKSLTNVLPICRYTLGLSGTTDRVDGMSPLFEAYLGKIIKPETDNNVIINVEKHYLSSDCDEYKVKINKRTGTIDSIKIITELCNYLPRTEYILNIIKEYLGEQILILSDRISFLDSLSELLKKENIIFTCNYGKKRTYKNSSNGIILATYSMASEAFDVQDLNVLILASSISSQNKFIQSVGRINRNSEINKNKKVLIDIIDEPLKYQSKKRDKLLNDNFNVNFLKIKNILI